MHLPTPARSTGAAATARRADEGGEIEDLSAVDGAGGRIEQQHLPSRGGHDLRDAGAHLSGADDEHAAERRVPDAAWRCCLRLSLTVE